MRIRSITYFCDPGYPLTEELLAAAGKFLARAQAAYEAAGYEVQTLRLATLPFPQLLTERHLTDLPRVAEQLDGLIAQLGIGYASLGPALPDVPGSYEVIPEAIAATRNVFFGGLMAQRNRGLDLRAVKRCAEVIVKSAPIDPNGFANLRFAALANVQPGSPFFPAAYHAGGRAAFAIATEAADLAIEAFTSAVTVDEGRRLLVNAIEKHATALVQVAQSLAARSASIPKWPASLFSGIDFSLSPFPAEARSLGTAFERLGVPRAGLHGSLAAAAILAEAVSRADFPRTGFSSLMLPVLEDATFAQRAADGSLSIKDLLLYSAVCGTGLDTIPLPGDSTPDQLVPLLLDLAALALRLDKPLTARLMPIPNKKAGDPTGFDFAFFANSRVMKLEAEPLHGALGGDELFQLSSR